MRTSNATAVQYWIIGILSILGFAMLFAWPTSAFVIAPAVLIGSGIIGSGPVGGSAYWLSANATAALYVAFVAWQGTLNPGDQVQVYTTYVGETQFFFEPSDDAMFIYWLFGLASILLLLSGLSVGVRRWHDHGKSGWWSLVALVPIVGALYAMVMLAFLPGTDGPNQYGDAR